MVKNITDSTDKYVIKRSGAIHVENKITLVQRKIWNVLLSKSFDKLISEKTHIISMDEMLSILDYSNKNYQYIYDNLHGLISASFRGNLLSKDGGSWVASTFLAGVEIKNGLIEYQFSDVLIKLLHKPEMYAKISLLLQNKFKSKYSLALYELCIDYFDVKRQYGETIWIPINIFRQLMGVEKEQYKDYRDLKKRTLLYATREINSEETCPIIIEFEERPKRGIRDIKFRIKPREKHPGSTPKQDNLFDEELKDKLISLGMTSDKASHFINSFDNDLIRDWYIVITGGYIKNHIKNKAGYLITMIEKGSIPPSSYLAEKKKANTYGRIQKQQEIVDRIKEHQEKKGSWDQSSIDILDKYQKLSLTEKDEILKEALVLFKIKEPEVFKNLCEFYATNIEEWHYSDYNNASFMLKYPIEIYIIELLK